MKTEERWRGQNRHKVCWDGLSFNKPKKRGKAGVTVFLWVTSLHTHSLERCFYEWMCVCVCVLDLIGASLHSHVSQWVQPCSVSVVRAETDGAQLFPDAHQTPRRLQKPFPRSLLSSLHLSLTHKVPRISLDGCFAEHGCRKNAFTLPPPAPGMWASPLLLCLHSLWIEWGVEKGTRVKTKFGPIWGRITIFPNILCHTCKKIL